VNGHIYTTAGVFKDTLKTVTRHCDSIRLTTTIQYLQPAPSSVSRLICKGDSLTINGHIHKLTGTYLDTLKAFRGCDSSYLTTNLTAVQVELVATNNATICNYLPRGDVQTVTTGGTAPYTYAWSNNLPAQSFQHCLERGIYTVTVTDMNGCKAIRPLSVVYNDLEGCLELEEGITPNGDGKNDTWEVPCLIDVKNSLVLYNRWGQLVYEAVDYKGGFEGIYNGHLLPDGVYYYIITIDGSIPHYSVSNYSVRKGNLTIMRH
jgi:gliding motility-associated-like protein